VDLLPVEPNPRGGHTPSWKISNVYGAMREQLSVNIGDNAREVIRLVTI